MKQLTLALALSLAPAILAAQATAGAQTEARSQAKVSAKIPDGFSVETRARLEAMIEAARAKRLPTEAMTDRMAEGKAKGATEAQIISSSSAAMGQLEASQQVLIRAGRTQPTEEEVTRGASLIAQGATSAQLEALVGKAPSDRRLEVAFEVVSQLSARGLPVDQALMMIGGRLGSGSSDGQLVSVLGSANARGGLGLGTTRRP